MLGENQTHTKSDTYDHAIEHEHDELHQEVEDEEGGY